MKFETKQLSIRKLNPKREFKLKLIKSLSDIRWDTKRISDFLNNNNTKTLFIQLRWPQEATKMMYGTQWEEEHQQEELCLRYTMETGMCPREKT